MIRVAIAVLLALMLGVATDSPDIQLGEDGVPIRCQWHDKVETAKMSGLLVTNDSDGCSVKSYISGYVDTVEERAWMEDMERFTSG